MLQLKCIGLNLSPLNSLEYAEGSIDVPVKIEFDNTYADHTKVLHVGYYDGNGAERGAKASLENDVFKIPGPVFAQSGIIFLSVHFSKTGESSEPETKPVYYQVQKTAGGVGSLPASYIWEPVVKRYVQEVIDNGDITFSTDSTLSKPGQAADAKVVGEEIEQLKKDNANYLYFGDTAPTNGALYWLDTSGDTSSDTPSGGDNSGSEEGGEDTPTEPTTPTLTSISATYSGGDVNVGTELTSLSGITVKANYSDGTSQTVTDYTLSGSIVEGANTITVTYGGLTTTFTVNGVVEVEVENPNLLESNVYKSSGFSLTQTDLETLISNGHTEIYTVIYRENSQYGQGHRVRAWYTSSNGDLVITNGYQTSADGTLMLEYKNKVSSDTNYKSVAKWSVQALLDKLKALISDGSIDTSVNTPYLSFEALNPAKMQYMLYTYDSNYKV